MSDWLGPTRQLDLAHPRLRITAHKLTQSRQSLPARAQAVYDYVRRLPFCAAPADTCPIASEVLARGRGDTRAKGVLFVALCRAAGLPARLQFVEVRARFLAGLLASPPRTVILPIAQVHTAGWVATDGYVVDPVLFAHAKHLLGACGRDAGWGIVRDARGAWDGASSSIQQFRAHDLVRLCGEYDDVAAFRASETASASCPVTEMLTACLVNWRIERTRAARFDTPAAAAAVP